MMGRPSKANPAVEAAYKFRLGAPSDIAQLLPVLRAYGEQCEIITEFGVRLGNSTVAFLSARPAELRSYDIEPFGLEAEFSTFGNEWGAGRFVFEQGDTLKIDIAETDLLFIDTLHTCDQLLGELQRHGNKARKWILIHDTATFQKSGEDGKSPGLLFAIIEWLGSNHENWRIHSEIPFNNGLTILERTK